VRVTEEFVGLQLEIFSAKGMAPSRAEIRERHLVSATDFCVHLTELARESIRRKPFDHRIRINERAVNPLRRRAEHSVKSNSVGVVGCHNRYVFAFINTTN